MGLLKTLHFRAVVKPAQNKALDGLKDEQRDLLQRLWAAELTSRFYEELYSMHYYQYEYQTSRAIEEATTLFDQCQNAGIAGWQIAAFLPSTHDRWWCATPGNCAH